MAEKQDIEGYGEIGKLLRAAREQKRMPLDKAAQMLHIRVRYLGALEQGRLHELPGLAYARGYLQSYAAFLGRDKEEIMRRFEEVEKILAGKRIYFPQVLSKEKTPNNHVIWGGLAFALVAYAFWAMLSHPSADRVSMVEKLAPHPVSGAENVACLRGGDVLYPPCTMVKAPNLDWLPMRSELKSKIDAAIADMADSDQEQ